MPLPPLPFDIAFLLFLLLFLVIGLHPLWRRALRRLRRLQAQRGRPEDSRPPTFTTWQQGVQLDDMGFFVLWRLSQAGKGGLTRRQLQRRLHLDRATVQGALATLRRQGLVRPTTPRGLSMRYGLTERGRTFAVAEGYLPGLHREPSPPG